MFPRGGDKFGVWTKEVGGWAGGGSLCEVLYPTLTKGGRMTQGQMPLPRPLKYSPASSPLTSGEIGPSKDKDSCGFSSDSPAST